MPQQQYCKVVNGAMVQAPGAITDGETAADGWLPVVDVGPQPGPKQTGIPTYVVAGQQVERSWSGIGPKPPERPELLSQALTAALPQLRAYVRASPPSTAATLAVTQLMARTLADLLVVLGRVPDDFDAP